MFMQQPESDRLVQDATVALANGHTAEAARLLAQAIRLDPRHPMALTKQAELAVHQKDHKAALALIDAAFAVEANFAPAWDLRAAACWLAGQQTEAVQAARRAVDIVPPNPGFRLRLARFATWTGRGSETREALIPLFAAEQYDKPHYAAAVSMLGELAIAEGRFDEADAYLDRALDLHPSLNPTRMQRGMNRLRLGEFRTGWQDFAAREAIPELYPNGRPVLADQAWQGQALVGKTLVVHDDQGHGDAIQFFRYLPLLRERGAAHITWRTFAPLARLLADAAPYATVVTALPGDARFDFQCNSTSLPRWFHTELDSVPTKVPYMRPPSRTISAMKRPGERSKGELSNGERSNGGRANGGRANGGQLKVGLVWSGDPRHTRDHLRSIPAVVFLGLTDIPGISFHSLQHEVRAADLPALEARPAIGREVEKAADFADTAALIARLDLVITVDTAIAHLAGALGKPVWVLVHVAPDWRWMADRADSPWYPTVRLFRVTPPEWLGPAKAVDGAGWGPVLGRVSTALRALAAS
jgi:tetratricopeptide (TPR) repeat protein